MRELEISSRNCFIIIIPSCRIVNYDFPVKLRLRNLKIVLFFFDPPQRLPTDIQHGQTITRSVEHILLPHSTGLGPDNLPKYLFTTIPLSDFHSFYRLSSS